MKIIFLEDISQNTTKGAVKDLPFGLAKIFIESGKAILFGAGMTAEKLKVDQQLKVDEVLKEEAKAEKTKVEKEKKVKRKK